MWTWQSTKEEWNESEKHSFSSSTSPKQNTNKEKEVWPYFCPPLLPPAGTTAVEGIPIDTWEHRTLTGARCRFLGVKHHLLSSPSQGPQVSKKSDCRMDVSKQRDVSPRFGSGLLTRSSKSVHPQREDPLLPNTHTLHTLSMLLTFRAAKKQPFPILCCWLIRLRLGLWVLTSFIHLKILIRGWIKKICQSEKQKLVKGGIIRISFPQYSASLSRNLVISPVDSLKLIVKPLQWSEN